MWVLNGEFWVCDHLLNHLWGDLVISMVDGLLVPVLVAPASHCMSLQVGSAA
jgi:hypothetical protein